MARVYIFAGFMTVLAVAGLAWLLIARVGVAIFRIKRKGKPSNDQPPAGTGIRRDDGDGRDSRHRL